jgi:anaerobic ribonucleoside-triphosphate reductase activating protein
VNIIMSSNSVRVAGIVEESIVDGPGIRFVLFTQGCDMRCYGCHNSESWDFSGGISMQTNEIITLMLSNPLTDGLTISGGEPFLQAAECAEIAMAAQTNGLNVWIYTGMTFQELIQRTELDTDIKKLLNHTDVLIDGPFILVERSLSHKWRGSYNQRLIDVKKSLLESKIIEI